MRDFETIVVGGGASGCLCALASDKKVAIIDKDSKLAKKLLVTGNGRCNLTNLQVDDKYYNTSIKKYLSVFDNKKTLEFFNELGLVSYSDEQGRVYPISNSAKSVQQVIVNRLSKTTPFISDTITSIKKEGENFVLAGNNDSYSCKKLVLACAKCELLDGLKIKYKAFSPSLCSLKSQSTRNLNNIRVDNVKVSAENNLGQKKSEIGEVLFKESGLSGIVIFNISSLFARQGSFCGKVTIDLLPSLSEGQLLQLLEKRRGLDVLVSDYFDGLFVKEIAYEILNRLKLNENRSCTQLNESELLRIAKTIKNLSFDVKGFYPNNQVYSGGVCLDDLDEKLQHKKVKNLYICGELCDVDGECGGYNLQWAWTSGYIVGKSI